MQPDARNNYSHILTVAAEVVTAHSANASMRNIARTNLARSRVGSSGKIPRPPAVVRALHRECSRFDEKKRRVPMFRLSPYSFEALRDGRRPAIGGGEPFKVDR